ncbi:hypothetical protein ACWCY6_09675 [Streptomyces sp. 900105755]
MVTAGLPSAPAVMCWMPQSSAPVRPTTTAVPSWAIEIPLFEAASRVTGSPPAIGTAVTGPRPPGWWTSQSPTIAMPVGDTPLLDGLSRVTATGSADRSAREYTYAVVALPPV